MLFVPAFAIGRHSAAALVHFAFTVALALAMLAYGRRIGKPWAGAAGALLTFASPVVGAAGSAAYVDVATAAIVFGVFYWTEIWDEHAVNRRASSADPGGAAGGLRLCGQVHGVSDRDLRAGIRGVARQAPAEPVLLVAGCALIMAGPWIARNWIWYQNPLAPFGNSAVPESVHARDLRAGLFGVAAELRNAEPAAAARSRRPFAGDMSTGSSDRRFCSCRWRWPRCGIEPAGGCCWRERWCFRPTSPTSERAS